jgi:hypothetical protein
VRRVFHRLRTRTCAPCHEFLKATFDLHGGSHPDVQSGIWYPGR